MLYMDIIIDLELNVSSQHFAAVVETKRRVARVISFEFNAHAEAGTGTTERAPWDVKVFCQNR